MPKRTYGLTQIDQDIAARAAKRGTHDVQQQMRLDDYYCALRMQEAERDRVCHKDSPLTRLQLELEYHAWLDSHDAGCSNNCEAA